MSPYRDQPEAVREIARLSAEAEFWKAEATKFRRHSEARGLFLAATLTTLFVCALICGALIAAVERGEVSPATYRACLRAGGDPTVCVRAVVP